MARAEEERAHQAISARRGVGRARLPGRGHATRHLGFVPFSPICAFASLTLGADEHLSITQYLQSTGIDGAIIVTTPQEVALLDVRKEINFCVKNRVRVLGVVENMAGFVCPNCKHESIIFKPSTGGAARMAQEMGVPFLGSVPLDPRLARACDEGKNFVREVPDSPATKAILDIVAAIKQACAN